MFLAPDDVCDTGSIFSEEEESKHGEEKQLFGEKKGLQPLW
jgi:hypothetical protein